MTPEELLLEFQTIDPSLPESEARLYVVAALLGRHAVEAYLEGIVELDATMETAKVHLEKLRAAALAYARPIVAEECAKIVEQSDVVSDGLVAKIFNNRLGIIAAAIREHGRGK